MRAARIHTLKGTETQITESTGASRQANRKKRPSAGTASVAGPSGKGKEKEVPISGGVKLGVADGSRTTQDATGCCRDENLPLGKQISPAVVRDSASDSDKPLLLIHEPGGESRVYQPPRHPPHLPPPFKPFGIEAYRTRARIDEVCILFTVRVCHRGSLCNRIHPKNMDLYRAKLQDAACRSIFRKNWQPPSSGSESELEQTEDEESEQDDSGEALSADEEPAEHEEPASMDDEDLSSPTSSDGPLHQKWEDEWGPSSTWDASRWFEGSSSHPPSLSSLNPCSSSRRSSDTEEERPARPRRSDNMELARRTHLPESHRRHASNTQPPRSIELGHQQTLSFQCPPIRPTRRILNHNTSLAPALPVPNNSITEFKREQRVKIPAICSAWAEGKCWRGRACPYRHPELMESGGVDSLPVTLIERHAPPPLKDICEEWLRDECERGYSCQFTHRDLDYDYSLPRRHLLAVPLRKAPEIMSRIVHKHVKIQITDGFEVIHITTGFETSWVYLGNIPQRVSHSAVSRLLQRHGEVIEVLMPEKVASTYITVKAKFTSPAEASKACATLNGLEAFGSNITARLSLVDSSAAGIIRDTSVRVTWEGPTRTAFLGYNSLEKADDVLERFRNVPFRDRILKVSKHTALPAVARYNLRFDGVPADTDRQAMKEFAEADDIVWGPVNYTDGHVAMNRMRTLVKGDDPDSVQFEVMSPPYKLGLVVAYAHLSTPAEAKALCDRINGRKPKFLGLTRIHARHEHTLEYSIGTERYLKMRLELESLKARAWATWHTNISIDQGGTSVTVQLKGEDAKQLRPVKAEMDIILWGEVVIDDKEKKPQWDPFFTGLHGDIFINTLRRQYPTATIRVETMKRRIRLFGPPAARQAARGRIIDKLNELRSKTVYELEVDARIIGLFMNEELPELSKAVGQHNIFLNLAQRKLSVRGDSSVKDQAYDALTRAKRKYSSASERPRTPIECPVCFNDVATPVTLSCGHSWCKTCLIHYLMTAIDQKFFPLTCLGNNAKCEQRIPLSCAKQLLNAGDFEKLVETAYTTHVKHNPGEFAYCPTPDCQQIYRPIRNKIEASSSASSSKAPSAPVNTTLQCPSCLVRICASCQSEAHGGTTCPRENEGDELFQQWAENNNVKKCPGCKVPIEKAYGCHHMSCTVCSTHYCWVCLKPFPNGSGVYSHMLAVHGSYV